MRHLRGERDVVVDPDAAELEQPRRVERAPGIARPDGRGEPVPLSTEPVSDTSRTSRWRTSPAPTGSPSPVITFRTPGGSTSAASPPSRNAVSGVSSDGLSTIVLPIASAGPIFQIAIISG